MNQENHFIKICAATAAPVVVFLFAGCQTQTNPWVGQPYQEPGGFSNPPQSIYAPMPSILAPVSATEIETDESLEAEFDLLNDQD